VPTMSRDTMKRTREPCRENAGWVAHWVFVRRVVSP
jgi:hypothetical protein